MVHWVHSIENFDDQLGFFGKNGKEAAEKMVYYLGLKEDGKDYEINELTYGYVILVDGVQTYWVQK